MFLHLRGHADHDATIADRYFPGRRSFKGCILTALVVYILLLLITTSSLSDLPSPDSSSSSPSLPDSPCPPCPSLPPTASSSSPACPSLPPTPTLPSSPPSASPPPPPAPGQAHPPPPLPLLPPPLLSRPPPTKYCIFTEFGLDAPQTHPPRCYGGTRRHRRAYPLREPEVEGAGGREDPQRWAFRTESTLDLMHRREEDPRPLMAFAAWRSGGKAPRLRRG